MNKIQIRINELKKEMGIIYKEYKEILGNPNFILIDKKKGLTIPSLMFMDLQLYYRKKEELEALQFAKKAFIEMLDKKMKECQNEEGEVVGIGNITTFTKLYGLKQELESEA